MEKDLAKKIVELTDEIDDEKLKSATNDELIAYLFLVEKMKIKLEKLSNMK